MGQIGVVGRDGEGRGRCGRGRGGGVAVCFHRTPFYHQATDIQVHTHIIQINDQKYHLYTILHKSSLSSVGLSDSNIHIIQIQSHSRSKYRPYIYILSLSERPMLKTPGLSIKSPSSLGVMSKCGERWKQRSNVS